MVMSNYLFSIFQYMYEQFIINLSTVARQQASVFSICQHMYLQNIILYLQWRDNKQVYGLNFSSKDDADVFANAMIRALEVILMTAMMIAITSAFEVEVISCD